MSNEPECIGMCDYDPESGICLGCGRLPECAAAADDQQASADAGANVAAATVTSQRASASSLD
ncbi:DUF1289 domain-containing protein [Rhodocyclus gracilis]|uniref:DUF1289 domain-containing protein n=1 Tax=Rhodocyclus gracilis TaxID=2929842 RepID=UPI0018904FD7|nr:DUF1289 domain-containing protein [Rhodocyclus gracilis]